MRSRSLISSEGVVLAALIIMGFLAGMAVQYAMGTNVDVSAGGGNTIELDFGNIVSVGAIIAVGIGVLGFLWTLSRDVSSLRERVAQLEEQGREDG